jgi:hypothetical protein
MKKAFIVIVALVLHASTSAPAMGQSPVPPPVSAVPLRSAAELDQLLGPIALYPDPLIAQLLPAAIQPAEIVLADRYLSGGGDPNQIDVQPWSASVKAMAHYPDVLKWMDDNLGWTTEAGQAFLYQPEDVMNAIQRLRAQAQALGNLQNTPQQTVVVDNRNIEIVPTNPEVIYVPVYQPDVVYVRRPVFGAGPFISFGIGFSIGAWLNHDWDWGHHQVVVWDRDHSRPRDWWYRPGPERFRPGGPQTDYHVWRPHARPTISNANREDRGWEVRQQRPEPARVETRSRPSEPVGQQEPRRQPEPRREQPRSQAQPQQAQPRVAPVEPRRAPEVQRPAAPPARVAPSPPRVETHPSPTPTPASNGALLGSHSAQETRQFSNRGQQSRQVQNPPVHNSPPPQQSAPRPAPASGPHQPNDSKGNKH